MNKVPDKNTLMQKPAHCRTIYTTVEDRGDGLPAYEWDKEIGTTERLLAGYPLEHTDITPDDAPEGVQMFQAADMTAREDLFQRLT